MKELPMCRVILAYGPYSVGDEIQPTGVFRDWLKARGFIELIDDEPEVEAPVQAIPRRVKAKRKKVVG